MLARVSYQPFLGWSDYVCDAKAKCGGDQGTSVDNPPLRQLTFDIHPTANKLISAVVTNNKSRLAESGSKARHIGTVSNDPATRSQPA